MSVPATYHSGTPWNQRPAVAKWHAHLRGLATAIHEIFGLTTDSGSHELVSKFSVRIPQFAFRNRQRCYSLLRADLPAQHIHATDDGEVSDCHLLGFFLEQTPIAPELADEACGDSTCQRAMAPPR